MKKFLKMLLAATAAFGLASCSLFPSKEEKQEDVPAEREEEEEEVVTYSAESVCEDFNAALAADGFSWGAEYDEEYEEYSFGVSFGAEDDEGNPWDESEEILGSAVSYIASYMPEYLEVVGAMYEDPANEDYYQMFQTDIVYYIAILVTPDESVEVDIYSYLHSSGQLVCFVSIYDIAE